MDTKHLFFPGCAAESTLREALSSSERLFEVLGLDVAPERGFSCCGARVLDEINDALNLAVNARNFALAEARGRDILTGCNTCFLSMKYARHRLDGDPEAVERINAVLEPHGLRYTGRTEVRHLVGLFEDAALLERFRGACRDRFAGRTVLPFYGCHILRPAGIVEDHRMPGTLDRLLEISGARIVRPSVRADCCGFHTVLADPDATLPVLRECLDDAAGLRADLVVTPCPLCHINLDMYQRESGFRGRIPVLHLSQYVLAAMGEDPGSLGLGKHLVRARI